MFYKNRIEDLEKRVRGLQVEIDETDKVAEETDSYLEKLEDTVEVMEAAQESMMGLIVMLSKKLKVTPKEFARISLEVGSGEDFLGKVNVEMTKIVEKKKKDIDIK